MAPQEFSMKKVQMHKPQAVREMVEVYQSESLSVDSTTTVMGACSGCHNLSTTHQNRTNVSVGVGASMPGANIQAVINRNGSVSASANVGAGFVVRVSTTSGAGPNISVRGNGTSLNTGNRTVNTSSSSARRDKTRTGG